MKLETLYQPKTRHSAHISMDYLWTLMTFDVVSWLQKEHDLILLARVISYISFAIAEIIGCFRELYRRT